MLDVAYDSITETEFKDAQIQVRPSICRSSTEMSDVLQITLGFDSEFPVNNEMYLHYRRLS